MSVLCSIAGCDHQVLSRTWCSTHYWRWHAHGSPTWEPPSPEQRFWPKVEKTDSCWLWRGGLDSGGYGQFEHGRAHRFAYELLVGPIPAGLQLDHLCRVKDCVRPDHLEPVTASENRKRAVSAMPPRTHCRRGHALTPANSYVHALTSYVHCRQCRANAHRRRPARTAA